MSPKDDNELVEEVLRGAISSFRVLTERYQQKIFHMMWRMTGDEETAKDLTQEVFLTVYAKLGTFNPRHRFFSWLYRIAVNRALGWCRSRRSYTSLEKVEPWLTDDSGNGSLADREASLRRALLLLDPIYRVPVLLKYYCGLSYEEISDTTGVPVVKVRSRLYMARERLRKEMLDNEIS